MHSIIRGTGLYFFLQTRRYYERRMEGLSSGDLDEGSKCT